MAGKRVLFLLNKKHRRCIVSAAAEKGEFIKTFMTEFSIRLPNPA